MDATSTTFEGAPHAVHANDREWKLEKGARNTKRPRRPSTLWAKPHARSTAKSKKAIILRNVPGFAYKTMNRPDGYDATS